MTLLSILAGRNSGDLQFLQSLFRAFGGRSVAERELFSSEFVPAPFKPWSRDHYILSLSSRTLGRVDVPIFLSGLEALETVM